MDSINQYYYDDAFIRGREEYLKEEHADENCEYIYLFNWHINNTDIRVTVFLRICFCKKYKDRSSFRGRKSIGFHEIGDGVECHFDHPVDCHFNKSQSNKYYNIWKFKKVCFCGRQQQTALR